MLFRTLKIGLQKFISKLFPKEKDLTVFGSSSGHFADNPKYMFLEIQKDDKAIWIADDKEISSALRDQGLESYACESWKGRYLSLRAEKAVVSHNIEDISFLASGAEIVNLWHGTALKSIDENFGQGLKSSLKRLYSNIFFGSDYFLLTSEKYQNLYGSQMEGAEAVYAGYPRNDIFYNDISRSELFAEKGIADRFILYMPTYRDDSVLEEKIDLKKMDKIFSDENTELDLLFKPHPNTEIGQDFENIQLLQSQKDLYPLLKSSAALITDYSSIMFDYMHTENPIIRFQFDKQEYENERGLNEEMKDLQPGKEVKTMKELEEAVKNLEEIETDYNKEINKIYESREEGIQGPHILDQVD